MKTKQLSGLNFLAGLRACGLVSLYLCSLQVCQAQDAIEKIQLYVPFPAGGSTYQIAKQIADSSNNSVEAIAVPGGGGVKGIDEATGASKARVVYILATSTAILNWETAKAAKFSSQFELVSLIGTSPLVLVTRTGSERKITAKNIGTTPNLRIGDPGALQPSSTCASAINKATEKNQSQLVPYQGTGPMLMELLRGSIDVACLPVANSSVAGLEKIGVTYKTSIQSLSALPVTADFGLNVQTRDFVALYRLKNGGKVASAQSYSQLEKVIDSADVRSLLQTQAFEPAR